jgi:hypothetical protein
MPTLRPGPINDLSTGYRLGKSSAAHLFPHAVDDPRDNGVDLMKRFTVYGE